MSLPPKEAIFDAMDRVRPFVHRTPVLTSTLLNALGESELFFKCENFQRMGAFKMRGAINAIVQLAPEQQKRGIVTHSSGNFAQAVSLAAKSLGIKAFIVMPQSAPKVKVEAVRQYGGEVILCESTVEARESAASDIVIREGACFLHPSNDLPVILGQGTAAIELLEEHPELDFILTPVGGGGLIAGTALAAHYMSNKCKVIGSEPFEADDAYRSLLSGTIETNTTVNTIADGLKTQLGDVNFPIIKKLVKEIIRVDEEEIIAAMRLIYERLKIVVEPSCALPLAAVLKTKNRFSNARVGIILSGGNVDLSNLPF